ncbi:MAG: hypothetical protein FJ119_12470 [Deltaproteobacteria bacterium]|nr:hypothetical protein [Deltaproteobacteria bacterium]
MKCAIAYCFGAAVCAMVVLCAAGRAHAEDNEYGRPAGLYTVQVMALKDSTAAHAAAEALTAKGYDAYVVTIADDTTGLPYKVRFGRFTTKQEAQGSAASYEMLESAVSYVVQESGTSMIAPAQPAAAVAAPPVLQGEASGSSPDFFERAVPGSPFGNLLGGRTYLEVWPVFSYRLQYEDNVDYDTSDKISDWSNVYMPEIGVNAIGPRFSLNSNAKLRISEYINERDFNTVDQDYSLTLGYAPDDRLEISGGIGYSVYNNTYRFFEPGGGGGIVDEDFERFKEESKIFNAGFSYELTPRSQIGLSGFVTQYTADDASDDNNFYGATAQYFYSYSPRTDLLLGAGYFTYDFSDADGSFSGYDYSLKNYSLTGGFDHTVDADFRFGAQAGFRYSENDSTFKTGDPFNPVERSSGNGNGWVASFDLEKRVNDFDFKFDASHDISISSRGANYESTRFLLTNTYNFTHRLNAVLHLQFRKEESDGDEFIGDDRDQDTYFVGSSLNYKLYRWLQLSLGHAYRYSDFSTGRGGSINSNLVFFQMRFTPLRPMVIR